MPKMVLSYSASSADIKHTHTVHDTLNHEISFVYCTEYSAISHTLKKLQKKKEKKNIYFTTRYKA